MAVVEENILEGLYFMPYCRTCGTGVDQDNKYCMNCGSYQGIYDLQSQKQKQKYKLPLILILILIGLGTIITTLYFLSNSNALNFNESLGKIIPWNQNVRQEDNDRASDFNVQGNSPGNIINKAFLAQQGNWLYFQGIDGIYKSMYNGNYLERVVYDNGIWATEINVVGDWIYYVGYGENNSGWWDNIGIYRARLDGSENYKVTDDKAEYINVIGDWIYYVDTDHEHFGDSSTGFATHPKYDGIYRIRVDGSERTRVIDVWASSIIVLDDWIYYTNTDLYYGLDWGIYRIRVDGTEHTRITYERAEYINVKDDWIYFFHDHNFEEREEYWGIYKVRTDGIGLTRLTDNLASDLNVSGDWIYFTQKGYIYDENEYGLYKVDLDGNNYTRLESGYLSNINIIEDWIYLNSYGSESSMIKRISFDGSESVPFYRY